LLFSFPATDLVFIQLTIFQMVFVLDLVKQNK